MEKHKNKTYQDLNKRLNLYLRNSNDTAHIDEDTKNKIWNNIIKDVHQEKLKRNYLIIRRYKAVVTVCILLVMLISVDLSSNASLFKRLLHSIDNNTIQFYTRNYDPSKENRDIKLDDKIAILNKKDNKSFISPIIPDNYNVKNINENGSNVIINMCSTNNNIIKVSQKYITNRYSTGMARYNKDLFEIENFNNNGIEYNIIRNNTLIITLFVIGEIEFEVLGNNKQEVLDITMSLHY
ncbi:hypothetical protein [Vallitalea sp.]|uniref:hypothetical protein n=1 Tax=Vallitalea sp. TaxID=1882829 RepID=UPI0025F4BC92|nr:hypothetical protein [Vallitalea sp.]MCT4685723.1 hypothetical protein [Vallitalea sp.]